VRKNLQEKTGEPNIIRNVEALYTVNAKENEKNLVNYSIKDEIKEQLKIHFPNQEARHQAMAEQIEETFNYMHLLSIFDLDHTKYTAGREIDGAILYSVLKAKGGRETDKEMQSSITTQLDLARKWKRIDIAEKYILRDKKWPVNMSRNIQANQRVNNIMCYFYVFPSRNSLTSLLMMRSRPIGRILSRPS
jgi:hypothetical protein